MKAINTAPCISTIIRQCLQGEIVTPLNAQTNFEYLINSAIQVQKQIGNYHVRYARIAEDWSDAQEDFSSQSACSATFDRQGWAAKVCQVCLTYSMELWKERNSMYHDVTEGRTLQRKALKADIIALRVEGEKSFHQMDKRLLDTNVDKILPLPKQCLELWKETLNNASQFASKMSQKCMTTTNSILTYFRKL